MTNLLITELPAHARIVIVGGGMAGLELAAELERRGQTGVLVLEAGPAADPRHVSYAYDPEKAAEVSSQPESDEYFRRSWTSDSPPFYDRNSGLRARLGGRSLYWFGLVLPLEPWALAGSAWPASIVADLTESWRGGRSLYDRLSDDLGVPLRGYIDPADAGPETITLGGHVFGPAPRAYRGTDDRWCAYSPLDHWRDPQTGESVGARGGVEVACDTEVESVVVGGGRATGVRVRRADTGEIHDITADAVVLCAGTVDSGRLAIDAIQQAEPTAPAHLFGLSDHLAQGFAVEVEPGAAPDSPLRLGSFTAVGDGSARSNFFLEVEPTEDGRWRVTVTTLGEQEPGANGLIRVPGEAGDQWRVRAEIGPRDRDVLRAQQEELERIWEAVRHLYDLKPHRLEFAEYGAASPSSDVPPGTPYTGKGTLGTLQHEGCLVRIGDTLDSDQQFVAVANLYAAGPTTFPRMGAANPTLTTLALSRRLGAHLADRPGSADR
ncbi:FAD-binding protein [Micromonospora aurantiaca (nom. illeg.)]|uniref:FAD-binding protein n=1 Tax=Micromonospora aurantiaca (nom. illeg.) TaxID=47850 RepID=UPI003658028B